MNFSINYLLIKRHLLCNYLFYGSPNKWIRLLHFSKSARLHSGLPMYHNIQPYIPRKENPSTGEHSDYGPIEIPIPLKLLSESALFCPCWLQSPDTVDDTESWGSPNTPILHFWFWFISWSRLVLELLDCHLHLHLLWLNMKRSIPLIRPHSEVYVCCR